MALGTTMEQVRSDENLAAIDERRIRSQAGLMKTPEAKQSGSRRLNHSRCARFVIRA